MVGKRKRIKHGVESEQKRQRISSKSHIKDPIVKHAVLAQCYPQVFTLREYLLYKLPATSKIRRKRILNIGGKQNAGDGKDCTALSTFLDNTLVGLLNSNEVPLQERIQHWTSFSQRLDTSDATFANLSGTGNFSQSEIVDFVIWITLSKAITPNGRPQHLLCQGFRKDVSARSVCRDEMATSSIPGVISTYPNDHVAAMKASPWAEVLALMGREGERMMIDLILDCGIFVPIESGRGSYHQLSGQPLGDIQPLLVFNGPSSYQKFKAKAKARSPMTTVHSPACITFVRNRMLYARAALNAQGKVRFGLRHIHVFNRFPYNNLLDISQKDQSAQPNTIHVMLYIFPRQFGLHNVFTGDVDSKETVQPFKDYTLREDEIHAKFPTEATVKIPKRLRGKATELVQKMQIQHSRCPYKILLNYYCPAFQEDPSRTMMNPQPEQLSTCTSTALKTQKSISANSETSLSPDSTTLLPRKPSMMDCATSIANVSAFCRATLHELIPREFWGTGRVQMQNKAIFDSNVDRFVKIRRFETLSLHEVSQGIKIGSIDWLGPPKPTHQPLSQSDLNKRKEIFHEFLYYVFDSILIPVIRANFYVTESNIHRYRVFFFRHDVWHSLAEPAIASLKITMFGEIQREKAQNLLDSRTLGFSQVRLLPKQTGVRPIMNLRRRALKKGTNVLGPSINSVLAPVYNALSFETKSNPHRLGSTLFSVGDLYTKLTAFKSSLQGSQKPLYFAKLDVQSAFDTIPQRAVLQLMASIPSDSEYRISKHVEIKPGDGWREGNGNAKPIRKWIALAKDSEDFQRFDENLESELAVGRKNTIFVENVVNQFRETDDLLTLLAEHVEHNMVKIGKKFYRQKEGIPQGSVLSSLLCNYFYADLEARHLQFLQSGNSLLLRLIDDFLLITTEQSHAKKFLQVMHDGLPAYGVRVNPDKTLVNFETVINGKKVERLVGNNSFPYCGTFINTKSLDITKDRERRKDMAIGDSLTVEFSRVPGKAFHRKILNTFKIQAHAMFLDTSHNSLHTVLSNIYSAFIETATKLYTYNRCLPVGKQPGTGLVTKTISDLVELAFVLMKSKGRNRKNLGYQCVVKKVQVEWLAMHAFRTVMVKKQSKFAPVISWLDDKIESLKLREGQMVARMKGVVSVP
ncbi:Telomerase reverse transcriptase [Hyphodiscus hymeniophilus]|uniref:Telomerase reverse transcriptase n=1 Tax=Hyphodiscus hymeniophilus TaxID=353542 RepID=A0A9P6VNG2_9HELO|nr:Telomerase reverse transcriptase [Hyphodiscus hymeniophilus]